MSKAPSRVPIVPLPRFMRNALNGARGRELQSTAPRPTLQAVPQTSKLGQVSAPNRNIATAPAPEADQGRTESRTYAQTYFTKVSNETAILYNGDRQWARVTLELETAGPVVVGTQQKITPVLSGKGMLLVTNEPKTLTIAKGTRLYIASTSINRVTVQVEPLPWLEQITGTLRALVGRLVK